MLPQRSAERKKIVLPNDNAGKERAGDHEIFRPPTIFFPAADEENFSPDRKRFSPDHRKLSPGQEKIFAGSRKILADRLEQFRATLANYRRHGWRLARALMTQQTLAELRREAQTGSAGETTPPDAAQDAPPIFEGAPAAESDFDAMWFRREAAGGREAWELRLAAEPYALFELFEADEAEEDREDVRRELEQRVRERAGGS